MPGILAKLQKTFSILFITKLNTGKPIIFHLLLLKIFIYNIKNIAILVCSGQKYLTRLHIFAYIQKLNEAIVACTDLRSGIYVRSTYQIETEIETEIENQIKLAIVQLNKTNLAILVQVYYKEQTQFWDSSQLT
jgi:hypothetical protein